MFHQIAGVRASLWAACERSLALHYEPESLLWDRDLREVVKPAECLTWDAMHILLSNGLVDNEMSLFYAAPSPGGRAMERN